MVPQSGCKIIENSKGGEESMKGEQEEEEKKITDELRQTRAF